MPRKVTTRALPSFRGAADWNIQGHLWRDVFAQPGSLQQRYGFMARSNSRLTVPADGPFIVAGATCRRCVHLRPGFVHGARLTAGRPTG